MKKKYCHKKGVWKYLCYTSFWTLIFENYLENRGEINLQTYLVSVRKVHIGQKLKVSTFQQIIQPITGLLDK